MPRLHRLNAAGIARFQAFIDSQSTAEPESFDIDIVTDPRFATPAGGECTVEDTCTFATRFDAGQTLARIVREADLPDAAFDRGVWCWLSWLWFESLCPLGPDGKRKPGEGARWILNLDWNRYYRHLLAGPWWIYASHNEDPERARALLCTEVVKPGELVAQIASRQELVSNPGLVGMLTRLFYNPETGKLRKGIAGKARGSARRLADVINQLDMIWDLYSTNTDEFIGLLPAEFDRYKDAA